MSEENKALVRRWFDEVWNRGRGEAIDELFAADGVAHGLGGEGQALRGPAGFHPFFESFRDAFPDIEVAVVDAVAEGDMVAARCAVRATHRSPALGFAATQRPVEFEGVALIRVRDGQITEAWNFFDFMSMFRQLGVLDFRPPADEALPAED